MAKFSEAWINTISRINKHFVDDIELLFGDVREMAEKQKEVCTFLILIQLLILY